MTRVRWLDGHRRVGAPEGVFGHVAAASDFVAARQRRRLTAELERQLRGGVKTRQDPRGSRHGPPAKGETR